MSNKVNAFFLAAGLALSSGAALADSCTSNCPAGGGSGSPTADSNSSSSASTAPITVTQGSPTANAGANSASQAGAVSGSTSGAVSGSTSGVTLQNGAVKSGDSTSGASSTSGVTLQNGAVKGGDSSASANVKVDTKGTVGDVKAEGGKAASDATAGAVANGNNNGGKATSGANANGNNNGSSQLTLNQTYQSRAAVNLGNNDGKVVLDGNCTYASNIAIGLSIVDEFGVQVAIPLGAEIVKGCPALKAELMTIQGGQAVNATPAQVLLGAKTAGKMAANTVGAALTEMTKPNKTAAEAAQLGNELALFTRPADVVYVQAPAAPAAGAAAVTINFNDNSTAAKKAVEPCPTGTREVLNPTTGERAYCMKG